MEWSTFFAASPDEREQWLLDPERTEEELTSTLERMVPRPRPGTLDEQTRLFGAILGNPNVTFDTLFAFVAAFGPDYLTRCNDFALLIEQFFTNMALPFLLLQGQHEAHRGFHSMLLSPTRFCLRLPTSLLGGKPKAMHAWMVPWLRRLVRVLERLEQGDPVLLDDARSILAEAEAWQGDAWYDEDTWRNALIDPLADLLGNYGLEGATTFLLLCREATEGARGSIPSMGLAPRFWAFCTDHAIAPVGRR